MILYTWQWLEALWIVFSKRINNTTFKLSKLLPFLQLKSCETTSEGYRAAILFNLNLLLHYEEMVGRETAASLRCSYFTAHVYTAIYFQK